MEKPINCVFQSFRQRPVFVVGIAIGMSASLVLAWLGSREATQSITGSTMGTFYSVTYRAGAASHPRLEASIHDKLAAIDEELSNWRQGSWIRRFNEHRSTEPFPIPHHAKRVLEIELELAERTNGALDPTLGKLIDIWGFGPHSQSRAPTESEITEALKATGHEKLELQQSPARMTKSDPDLELNCSAVAKGYAVDLIAETLESRGIRHYLINLGGEVRARGRPRDESAWMVAIERPVPGSSRRKAILTTPMTHGAMATSGDYRRFKQTQNDRYPHLIDPSTGHPLSSSLAGATILAPNCAYADGLATACLVLGLEGAGKLIRSEKSLAAVLVERLGPNRFRTHKIGLGDLQSLHR